MNVNEWDTSKLRGRIVEKFGNLTMFSQHIKRTQQFISRVLNNKAELTMKDMNIWIDALEIQPDEIYPIFFVKRVYDCKQENEDAEAIIDTEDTP